MTFSETFLVFLVILVVFLGVKFGFRKSCLCKRNDKYEVCPRGAATGDWTSALWLQQHSENNFLGHPLDVNLTTQKSNFWRLKCSNLQVIPKEKLHWNALPRHAQPPLVAKPPNPGEHPISFGAGIFLRALLGYSGTKWSIFWLSQQIWVPSNSE